MRLMTIKEVQAISLDIVKDLHDFCSKNSIRYSLSGGTLIGAIRHQGFIPWDEDVDVVMPRPDYERFIKSYKSTKGYQLFSHEIEGGDKVELTYARICEMKQTFVDQGQKPWTTNEVGVWFDIFPLDGAPRDRKEAEKKVKHMTRVWLDGMHIRTAKYPFCKTKGIINKLKLLGKRILYFHRSNIDSHIQQCKEYDFDSCDYYCNYTIMHYGMKEYQRKSTLVPIILHKFEDTELCVMSGYDEYLRIFYGDYMKLPPEEQRRTHDYNGYFWKND